MSSSKKVVLATGVWIIGLRPFTVNREDMSVRLVTKRFSSSFLTKPCCFSKPDKAVNICVEGNIGSGKTTFIQHLAKIGDIDFIEEPGLQYQHVEGHAILAKMSEDPARWSFTLQNYVQLTMLEQHIRVSQKPVKMMERSINSAQFCFVKNFHKSGKMTDMEYVILNKWFNWISKSHDLNIGLTVYLQTTPDVVYERIKSRGRSDETEITLEYLWALHELHEDWLVRKNTKFSTDSRVMVIDANQQTEVVVGIFLNMLNIINKGIYSNLH